MNWRAAALLGLMTGKPLRTDVLVWRERLRPVRPLTPTSLQHWPQAMPDDKPA